MKRTLFLLLFLLNGALILHADDKLKDVQTELKTQGFYYGEVDGKGSPELTAAVRRYQIRNGLEVTGDLSKETLDSLGIASGSTAAASPTRKPGSTRPEQPSQPPTTAKIQRPPAAPEEPARPRPPVNLRREDPADRDSAAMEADRRVLRQDDPDRFRTPGGAPVVRPPAPLDEDDVTVPDRAPDRTSGTEYAGVFAGTPYATAPRALQDQTLRRAQRLLAERGYYRDLIDGLPGPATEEALLSYQRNSRLPLTGRLDLQTLNALRLLPGRGAGNPPLQPFNGGSTRPARPQTTFRGIWVE